MTKNSDNQVECSHCLLKFNRNTAIVEEIEGKKLYFCCPGCQSVFHIIKEGGFDSFYKKRRDYKPGPVSVAKVAEDSFLDDVTEFGDYSEIEFLATNIRCAACIWLIENYLSKLEGVLYIRVNYATHRVKVRWKKEIISLESILNGIANLGYIPVPISLISSSDFYVQQKKDYFYRFAVGAFFSMQLMIYSVALYAGYFQGMEENLKNMFRFIAMILATPVVFYSGLPFTINTFKSLKSRVVNMDTLVFMGSYSAYFYSVYTLFTGNEIYFDTSAMIITLILLGRYIETEAKIVANKEISLLFNLQPKQAKIFSYFDADKYLKGLLTPTIVKSSSIKAGDIIEVLPGENIPVDGEVIYGDSDVDQSMFTGESIPVFKKIGSTVTAGTMNLNGTIIIKATVSSKETSLNKIAEAIRAAQETKFYFQRLADKITVFFVPFVIAVAFGTFLYWLQAGFSFKDAFMVSVSILVIACPCAMGLATPLAILISTSTAFKSGILIKEGTILENANKVRSVFFDKTGTITEGVPSIVNVKQYNGDVDILKLAASLERYSKHVLAKSIVNSYTGELFPVSDVKEIPGYGICGFVNSRDKIVVGNLSLMKDCGFNIDANILEDLESFSRNGWTNIIVAYKDSIIGIISLFDSVRSSFKDIYDFLLKNKIGVSVLTGDIYETTSVVLKDFEKIKIYSSLTPLQKAEIIKNNYDKFPMMLGDGINDAPSLKQAFIGIAMGKGTDIALETADAVFINSDISLLKRFFEIAKKTRRIIMGNLFWAFSYNFVTIPLAMMGKIHPVVSAVLMSISSLFVVFNSLRIKILSRKR
ncbi:MULTISPECIES: heavy metal translocating P-type ATPase [Calditerrivibrio]